MQGKIIKGIAGFYYVHTGDLGVYECNARGAFRNDGVKPLVGDDVEIDIISEAEHTGNVSRILPRKNELIRPAAANIGQALVVFASLSPEPNFNLLSRFLVMMGQKDIDTVICFNKSDQLKADKAAELADIFAGVKSRVIATSTVTGEGIDELAKILLGKTTALAGPSGVGKSSILNAIFPEANSRTGEISAKINRGRHTTRHTEIFNVAKDTYIMDTPGFTSLECTGIEAQELRLYFDEFAPYEGKCRYNGCVHIKEPECAVKRAVEDGKINRIRYDIYVGLYNEMRGRRKY
ncbi:MAG: ribosome small subunit-dependent GTPase A [Butyrivibrio sp.]|nr:ribosome small subunit-dependent GTPase A [Butyrivibrio sp.]